MAFILSLETSTNVCSVAVHQDGKLLANSELHKPQSQASKLAMMIKAVLQLAEVDAKQLAAVAITSGPGSYTGLRIGTSTAKGLCYALNIPLIAIKTLDLLAYQANRWNTEKSLLCPMIDARRMEVYCQVVDADFGVRQSIEAKIIDETSFLDFLNQERVLFFGDGVAKCREVIQHPQAIFLNNMFPNAAELGVMANQKLQNQQTEDLQHFEPFYLKDFVAKKPLVKP